MAYLTGVGRQLVAAAKSAPFLDRDEEHNLAVRWKTNHDERALHQLTEAHMRLVIALAVRFRHYGLPIADLIQEGHVGLLEAAARFDPEREVRFSTYATWWIRAGIQDYILRNWSIVRGGTSSAQKALFFNLRRLRAKLANSGGGSAMVFDTIAETLGVSRRDVEFMDSRMSAPDLSLNAPVSDADPGAPSQRLDFLQDDGPLPERSSPARSIPIAAPAGLPMRSAASRNANSTFCANAASSRMRRRSNRSAISLEFRKSACARSKIARWKNCAAP